MYDPSNRNSDSKCKIPAIPRSPSMGNIRDAFKFRLFMPPTINATGIAEVLRSALPMIAFRSKTQNLSANSHASRL